MVNINNNQSNYHPPFSIVIIDAMDCYYYADIFDNMEKYSVIDDYNKAIIIADALFIEKNKKWETLDEMNSCDGGYDVRIYDSKNSCVYAVHTKYLGSKKIEKN